MRSGGPHLPRVRALDGLRGVAVLGVLLFHGGLLAGGYLGVDLFFVLSGYLITSLLLVEVDGGGTVALGRFWARRARRLLPALVLVIGAALAYAVFVADSSELGRIRGDVFASLGYVANWRLIVDKLDYWSLFQAKSPLMHTWSLAIEEQFYIVWPLVVLLLVRYPGPLREPHALARRIFVFSASVGAGLAAWALLLWLRTHDGTRVYYGTDTRVPAILAGAALAGWLAWRGPVQDRRSRRRLEIGAWTVVAGLAYAWTHLQGVALYQGGLVLCGVGAVVLVAAASHPRRGSFARALSAPPLVGLGLISYGLYLWHWPIFLVLDQRRTGLDGWTLFGVRVTVTLAVTLASYRWVEMPVRRGMVTGPTIRRFAPAIVAAAVLGTTVATAGATSLGPDHFVAPNAPRMRRVAERRGAVRVMVGGNSVAHLLADDGMAPLGSDRGLTVLNDGVFSCDFPPAHHITTDFAPAPAPPVDCTQPWADAIRDFDPNVVVLVFGDVHTTRYHFADGWAGQCEPRYSEDYLRALDDAATRLGARGARVVLTTSAYTNLYLPADYNLKVRRATECTNSLIREYAATHPRVGLVDLNRFVCPGGACHEAMGGAVLRPDGVHYRGPGARLVAAWILDRIGLPPPHPGT